MRRPWAPLILGTIVLAFTSLVSSPDEAFSVGGVGCDDSPPYEDTVWISDVKTRAGAPVSSGDKLPGGTQIHGEMRYCLKIPIQGGQYAAKIEFNPGKDQDPPPVVNEPWNDHIYLGNSPPFATDVRATVWYQYTPCELDAQGRGFRWQMIPKMNDPQMPGGRFQGDPFSWYNDNSGTCTRPSLPTVTSTQKACPTGPSGYRAWWADAKNNATGNTIVSGESYPEGMTIKIEIFVCSNPNEGEFYGGVLVIPKGTDVDSNKSATWQDEPEVELVAGTANHVMTVYQNIPRGPGTWQIYPRLFLNPGNHIHDGVLATGEPFEFSSCPRGSQGCVAP